MRIAAGVALVSLMVMGQTASACSVEVYTIAKAGGKVSLTWNPDGKVLCTRQTFNPASGAREHDTVTTVDETELLNNRAAAQATITFIDAMLKDVSNVKAHR